MNHQSAPIVLMMLPTMGLFTNAKDVEVS